MISTCRRWLVRLLVLVAAASGGAAGVGQPPPQPLWPDPKTPNPGRPEDPKRSADYRQRQQSERTLQQLVIGLHGHESAKGHLPTNYRGANGKPLLSWRVALLPYLEQAYLFQQFKLDEPWDGPTNKPLLAKMPDVYRLRFQPREATSTYYQTFAGPGTAAEPGRKLRLLDFTDGVVTTLAVAEVGPAVPWTKPADVAYDPANPFPKVVWPFSNVITAAAADGTVHRFVPTLPELVLRHLISRNGGEVITLDKSLRPPLRAESPEEKAEVAKLLAAAKAKLAVIERLEPVPGQEVVEELNQTLQELLNRLNPPAK